MTLRRSEAKNLLSDAWFRAGYTSGRVNLRRAPIGWFLDAEIDHADRSYVTTTGVSHEYATSAWALTLKRLVRLNDAKYAGQTKEGDGGE